MRGDLVLKSRKVDEKSSKRRSGIPLRDLTLPYN